MFSKLMTFFGTVGKQVGSKVVAGMGPAAKAALASLDPKLDLHHTVKVHSKNSRLHLEAGVTLDASINLPGDLDDAAAGAINATGLIGLGNSRPAGSEPGDSPSN